MRSDGEGAMHPSTDACDLPPLNVATFRERISGRDAAPQLWANPGECPKVIFGNGFGAVPRRPSWEARYPFAALLHDKTLVAWAASANLA